MTKAILLIALLSFVTQVRAQRIMQAKAPATVKDAFHKAYRSVTDVDWSKDGDNFEAEYDVNKVDILVTDSAK